MKQENFILAMLIPGPESPCDAIDVYLQPLTEELNELWESGVETFDASTRKNFMLHASLLWTINDFPTYANLSIWSIKRKWVCPCCNKNTHSTRLKMAKNNVIWVICYLLLNHKWRNEKASFDNTIEHRDNYWIEPREMHSSIASQGFTVLSPGWASGGRPGIFPSFITIESALSRLSEPLPPLGLRRAAK
ncbi:hypothetical protein MTR67_001258 [Solanum verrucosum]|uniref:Uncharacterized protein n=1 Tax=Solanum verrucosum TaxID=315347 RepID=A0AAF0PMX9_SOLVR|nr:hypothetical protein MTR67_001258 [Solanum verrucosum]